MKRAVAATPDSHEYRFNLGRLLAAQHSFAEALPEFEKAVELTGGQDLQSLEMLAAMYSEVERFSDAAATARKALAIAVRDGNGQMIQVFNARIEYYKSQAGKH